MNVFVQLVKMALPFKWWIILSALIGFCTVASGIGLMMTSAYIIAMAALQPSIAVLHVAIAGVRFFGISRGIFRYLERMVSHNTTLKLLSHYRVWFYEKLESFAELSGQRSGDLLNKIVNDIQTLEHFYVRVLYPPVVSVLIICVITLLMRSFSWVVALMLFVLMSLTAVGVPLLSLYKHRKINRNIVSLRSELSALTVENMQGMHELAVYGRIPEREQKIDKLSERLTSLQKKRTNIHALHHVVMNFFKSVTLLVILIITIPQVTNAGLSGVFLAVIVLGILAAFEAVAPLPSAAQHWEEINRAAQRLFDIAETSTSKQPTLHLPDFSEKPSLMCRHIHFTYPDGTTALKNFSLTVHYGEKIAIVGPTGSGKSTLIHLLLKFYQPDSGCISVGRQDLLEYPAYQCAEMFGVVPQHPYVFTGTIRDNLNLANPHAEEKEIRRACEKAGLYDFMQTLPGGPDTWIGEHGLRLSGGEKQRLALAQGFLRSTPFLVFDEPSAHLDAVNERHVFNEIYRLRKPFILITHRLIDLHRADRILVVRNGEIVERGTHDELLKNEFVYAKMWQNQQRQLIC